MNPIYRIFDGEKTLLLLGMGECIAAVILFALDLRRCAASME